MVHENFIALDREKRDRIINAAMSEFTTKGYKNASTNEIVKNAGISKGALFHYFSTKRDLYEFLFGYGMDFFMEALTPRIKELPADVFRRWIAFSALKMQVAAQYPGLSDFMRSVYREEAVESHGLLMKELDRFSGLLRGRIYDGVDLTRFREDIGTSSALKIIWWVLEGFATSKQEEFIRMSKARTASSIQPLVTEMEGYLDMLRKAFYKTEYHENQEENE